MTGDDLAKAIMDSIARHQSRGLIYAEDGMAEVVMHGRVDMLAVAGDLTAVFAASHARRSWAPWFTREACRRRGRSIERRGGEEKPLVEAAIARLRMRTLEAEGSES